MPSTSTSTTVQKLRTIFATHGLPEILVSNNATCFTSAEFQEPMTRNGIRHITSAPYHPATNGLAERAVQIFKNALKKSSTDDIETQLSQFLFHYRNTAHTTTGVPPAKLLLGRRPRSHMMLMQPSVSTGVRNSQLRQKSAHDHCAKERQFSTNDPVFAKNFSTSGPSWIPGTISEVRGKYAFTIQLADGRVARRHIDHIRLRTCTEHTTKGNTDYDFLLESPPTAGANSNNAAEPELRRSARTRNAPKRLM